MIWKGIIALCSSKTAITNQIGSSPMRLFPIKLPQGMSSFPAVAGRVVSNVQTKDFSGDDDQFDYVSYDFHCYGETKKQAEQTAKVFRDTLNGVSGTYNGIEFNDIRFSDSGSEDYLSDLELYTYSIEINFNVRG